MLSFKQFIKEDLQDIEANGAGPYLKDLLFGKSARKRFLKLFRPWFDKGGVLQDVGIVK